MTLFCLPYAGGSSAIFYDWKKLMPSSIKLEPIELKGRGKRFNEGHYNNLDEAVNDIFLHVKSKIIFSEYAIFGHSMGSLLAYELYYKILREGLNKPCHIFFSGHAAPSAAKVKKNLHLLSDDEFIKEVMALGGMPEELKDNEEIIQLILPNLRNDFRITESYIYTEKESKIDCDITIFNGKDDDMTLDDILSWKVHSKGKTAIHNFKGNHFFINENAKNIVDIICSTIKATPINLIPEKLEALA